MSFVTNKTQPAVTASQAIANFKASSVIPAQSIVDSSAGVASLLDQLLPLAMAGDIASITLTDTQPLSITAASYLADSRVLALLPAGYSLVVTGVAAAGASSMQSAGQVTSFTVADTVSAVASNLDALNGATRLNAISLTNGNMLTITVGQLAADTVALSKLPSNYQLTVAGVMATGATSLQAASHVVAFSVTDTAANVTTNLASLNAASKLSSITLTDIATLTVTYAQFTMYVGALARLAVNDALIVTGVTAAGAAAVQANTRVKSFSVTDSAAPVAANLNALNVATKLTGILLADTAPLSITSLQLGVDTWVLGRLPANAKLVVSGATAATAAGTQANSKVISFNVSDTAANVVANLSVLNAATKLQAILLTDSLGLAITTTQITAYAAVLAKLPTNYGLTVSGVAASGAGAAQASVHVRSFSVTDSSANVAAYLDALNGCTRLTSVSLTDVQSLPISYAQYSNDATTLGKITIPWSAIVSFTSAAAAAGVQANSHVRSFSISDSATQVVANLDALNNDGKLTAINLTGSTTLALGMRQLAADTYVLSKIASGFQLNVSGASVSDLAMLLSNPHVTAIQVADTAANIVGALSILSNAFLVASITISGGTTLAVNYTQLTAYGAALRKLATADRLTVSGVTAANAQAVQATSRVSSFSVSDTAANIVANLDSLNADGKLSAITMTGATTLALSYAQFISDSSALGKLTGAYTLTVDGTSAAGATLVAANMHVTQFTVSDTIGDIGAKLDQLEAAVKTGKLTSIMVTDTGGSITIPPAQYSADAGVLALMHGSYSINQPAASGSATINLIWDARAQAAPAAFRSAVTYAAQYFQTLITNPVTINISVGYGEVGGSTLGGGVLGAAGPTQGIGVTYAQFKSDLAARVTSATMQTIVNNLSAVDPAHGGSIYVASAEEKVLGLMSATNTRLDGIMGFAADPNGTLFTYDPNNRAVAGKYDLIGVVEHEISHALGRIAMGGTYGSWISTLDVFRYSAPGVHSPNAGGNAYFSIDGGTTNLDWFSNSSDLADWASSAGHDANNAFSSGSVVNQFTATDITEMNALGFATSGTPSSSSVSQTTVNATSGLNAPSLSFLGSPPVAFMTDDLPIIDAALRPADGIEEIAQFVYGVNELRIDLQGVAASALVAFDTMVDGLHAIALANNADSTHGLVLTNMPGNDTAADLMANHLTFSGGQAVVA